MRNHITWESAERLDSHKIYSKMKKILLTIPFFLLSCQNNKKNTNSTIFGNDNNESNMEIIDGSDNDEVQEIETEQFAGNKYIDLEIPNITGGTLRISDYVNKNKITVIDCWASWCKPCMIEMPNIARLYRKYHNLGVEIIGISFDEDAKMWNAAVKNNDMVWPQLSELKGWDNQMFNVYGIHAIPHTIIINNKGDIVGQGLRGEDLINAIAKELSK